MRVSLHRVSYRRSPSAAVRQIALAPTCWSFSGLLQNLPFCNFQTQNGQTVAHYSVSSQQMMPREREEDLNPKLIVHQRTSHLGDLLTGKTFQCKRFSPKNWKPIGVGDKQIAINQCDAATVLATHGFFWLRENLQEWLWSCSSVTTHRSGRRV